MLVLAGGLSGPPGAAAPTNQQLQNPKNETVTFREIADSRDEKIEGCYGVFA